MSSWDYRVSFYQGSSLIYETVHRGEHSMTMEVDIFWERLLRGEGNRIIVSDMRFKWQREMCPAAWWAVDLTQTITRSNPPSWRTKR